MHMCIYIYTQLIYNYIIYIYTLYIKCKYIYIHIYETTRVIGKVCEPESHAKVKSKWAVLFFDAEEGSNMIKYWFIRGMSRPRDLTHHHFITLLDPLSFFRAVSTQIFAFRSRPKEPPAYPWVFFRP